MNKPKSFFNEYEAASSLGIDVSHNYLKLGLDDAIDFCLENGYSLRDMEYLCHQVVAGRFAEAVLRRAVKFRKQNQ